MSDYEIGYARPPKSTRFKPGQSGNPKGRKKGSMNLDTILMKALDAKITVETPAGTKRITKKEAIAMRLVNKAAMGDPKSIQTLLPWMSKVEERNKLIAQKLEDVTEQDDMIIKGFIDGIRTNNAATSTASNIAE
ncbi:MAG: hypothetical protein IKN73_04005 [Alphaproteobacteria bacterium]|nr:hypothetical protein [Alphaproteobacteria bacterium]